MKHPGKEAGMDDKQDIEFSALEPVHGEIVIF